ncbi:MAG: hypothetical protein LUE29_01695 [Lachnospiraceae bacterium]|nr:hypothetical protein [Lachnospiraceae bacterium]
MKNYHKLFNIIYILLIVGLIIFLIIEIYCEIMGTKYVYINSSNEADITEILEEEEISINGELKYVAWKQGLGDWTLYIGYKDGNWDSHFWNDGIAGNIQDYIIENGVVGGIKGRASRNGIGLCIIFLVPFSLYKLYCC